jgi:hypothetical protein
MLNDGSSTPYDQVQGLFRKISCLVQALYYVLEALNFQSEQLILRSVRLVPADLCHTAPPAQRIERCPAAARVQACTGEAAVCQQGISLSYSVSHDLKALCVPFPIGLLDRGGFGPHLDRDGQENCSCWIDRTQHMHNLIDGILAYSRIGRIPKILQR